jgi:2-hydroxychromene-2-carboxylate isomerase
MTTQAQGASPAAIWHFDVISPFAWLALGDIEELGRQMPIIMRPILFAGLLKHWGQLGPAEIGPKRLHTYRLCVFEAERRGVPFRFPPAHPFNPLRALRLLCALDAAPAAIHLVMERIWKDGQDITDEGVWRALCHDLDVADPDGLIEETGAKERLRLNTEAAIASRVFGVPTLELGGELFWGVDALPMARAYLANPSLFAAGEMKRVGELPGFGRHGQV